MDVMAVPPPWSASSAPRAGLDVDKTDLKRFSEFAAHEIYDLLVMAVATAKANTRDVTEPHDLSDHEEAARKHPPFPEARRKIELKRSWPRSRGRSL